MRMDVTKKGNLSQLKILWYLSYRQPAKAPGVNVTRKGPAHARVSTDIFHDGLRRETCSDTRITLAQYLIILVVHSVHFANF